MRYTISSLHEKKGTSLKHVFSGVRDNMYTAGGIFIILEFLFYIIFVPYGGVFSIGLLEFHGNKLCCITC